MALPRPTSILDRLLARNRDSGAVNKTSSNLALILEHEPEWKGSIVFDLFASRMLIARENPAGSEGHWVDINDIRTQAWFQTSRFKIDAGIEVVRAAVALVAHNHASHPLRDRLNALEWDTFPRLDTWLHTYLGSPNDELHRAIGVTWCLSAVKRAFEPGCQADAALILEGKQGLGKSSALRVLSLGWFADEVSDIGSKDAAMQLLGVWIVELAELDAVSKASLSRVKSFMTRRVDHFRAPFERHVADHPRSCVFAGSVNDSEYLSDDENRRFLPVHCTRIDVARLSDDVDQLWAEALVRWRHGEEPYIPEGEIKSSLAEHTAERNNDHPWTDTIVAYGQQKNHDISTTEALTMVKNDQASWTQADKNIVAKILKKAGYHRVQVKIGPRKVWRYLTQEKIDARIKE